MVFLMVCARGNAQSWLIQSFDKLFKERESHSSIAYNVDYYVKKFSREDTLSFHGHVKLVRDSKDTILGGIVYMDMDTNGWDMIRFG